MKQIVIFLLIISPLFCGAQDSLIKESSSKLEDSVFIWVRNNKKLVVSTDSIIITVDTTLKAMGNLFRLHGLDQFGHEYTWTTRSAGLGSFPTNHYTGRRFLWLENGTRRNKHNHFKLLKQ